MRPVDNQLLSVQAVYSFCKGSIRCIADIFCSQKKNLHWLSLFWKKGMLLHISTRSFHHFASVNVGILKFKPVSVETSFSGIQLSQCYSCHVHF